MSITEIKDQFISAQWGSFLEESIIHLDQSREVYVKNKNEVNSRFRNGRRKAIAIAENIPASIALTLAVISLEGLANTTAYRRKIKNYNQWDSLTKRIASIVSLSVDQKQAVDELSMGRDCIVHGWVWQKTRRYKEDFSTKFIKSYLWKPYRITPGRKFRNLVDLNNRATTKFRLSIIPIDINFLDGLMSLSVVEKILDLFGYRGIVPRLYTTKNRGFSRETAEIPADNNFCTLQDWIGYFYKILEANDRKVFDFLTSQL
jgi:hypothetical protein